jgi:hypothetical protein
MSESSGVSVTNLLPESFHAMEALVRNEFAGQPGMAIAGTAWSMVAAGATDAVRTRLNFDFVDLLARGWAVARELHKYKDKAKYPDHVTSVVHLGKHEMKTESHPLLSITVGGYKFPEIRLTLELKAVIEAVALSIQRGRVTGVGSGECWVTAQLKYGTLGLHDPTPSRKVKLPGARKFDPGIAIP